MAPTRIAPHIRCTWRTSAITNRSLAADRTTNLYRPGRYSEEANLPTRPHHVSIPDPVMIVGASALQLGTVLKTRNPDLGFGNGVVGGPTGRGLIVI